jgi:hypothetical protein
MMLIKFCVRAMLYAFVTFMQPVGVDLPIQCDKVQTPITEFELENVLYEAHVDVFGKKPSENRLAMGWAQVALENGAGAKTYNFNLGNIGASERDSYYNVSGHHYRNYGNFMQSARTYWHIISRCNMAVKYFDAGYADAAAHALRRCGYFRADVDAYSSELSSLFNKRSRNIDVKW